MLDHANDMLVLHLVVVAAIVKRERWGRGLLQGVVISTN
jgi:hypothetical protein